MNLNELVEDLGINFNKVAAISDKIATRASPEAYIKYVSFQEKSARRDAATPHVHSKLFQENVLDGTKREYYDTWFRKNVLDGTKSWSQ